METGRKQQVPFDFAQGRLSTPLRSGRDDNAVGRLTVIQSAALEAIPATELSSQPERTRICYITALHDATYVAFRKESHMKFANTIKLDRND